MRYVRTSAIPPGKRLLSLFVALCMVLYMVPALEMTVYAADDTRYSASNISVVSSEGLSNLWGTGPEKLFDGSNNKCCVRTNNNVAFSITFKTVTDIQITGYIFQTADDTSYYSNRNPKSWTLAASNSEAGPFTTIDTRTGQSLPAKNYTDSSLFSVSNDSYYQYYKLTITELGGINDRWNNGYSVFQLAEMKIYGGIKPSTVTFDRQGGTGGSASVTANYNSAMPSATAPTRTGYTFSGYYTATNGGGTQYYDASMGSVRNWDKTADTTLYAKWTAQTSTVTLDRQSGAGGSASVTATYNSAMPSATAPTRTGYTFGGYYDGQNGSGTQYYNASMGSARSWNKTGEQTLYAKWTAQTSAVTLDRQGGTGGSAGVTPTYAEAMPTATAPTRAGYTFSGYYDGTNGSGTQYYNASMGSVRSWDKTGTQTLYAKWTANTYTVTLDRQSGTGGSASVTATYNAVMPTITVPTRTGYTFGGYYNSTNGGGTQYYNATGGGVQTWNYASGGTLYAQWTAQTSTVTFDRQSGTGGSASVTATFDSSMPSATAPTRAGYTFGGYYDATNGGGTQYYNASMGSARVWNKTGAQTLYAKWTKNDYVVTLDTRNGSREKPTVTAIYTEEMPAITLPTRAGYVFGGYYTAPNGSGEQYYTASGASARAWDRTENTTLYAHWVYDFLLFVELDGDGDSDYDAYDEYDELSDIVTAKVYLKTANADTLQAIDLYVTNSERLVFQGFDPANGSVRIISGGAASTATRHHLQLIGSDTANPINVTLPVDTPVLLGSLRYTFAPDVVSDEQLHVAIVTDEVNARPNIGVARNADSVFPAVSRDIVGAELKNEYTVIYYDNVDGEEISVPAAQTVGGGHPVELSESEPVRTEHDFLGWNTAPDGSGTDYVPGDEVTLRGDLDIYAQWQLRTYPVRWMTQSGEDVIDDTRSFAKGEQLVNVTDMPTKAADERYTYTFAGWATLPDQTSGLPADQYLLTDELFKDGFPTLYAAFTTTDVPYDVVWKNYDGTVLEQDIAIYDEVPTYDGDTPTQPENSTYTYVFNGWTPTVAPVTGNAEYTAVYTPIYIDYAVTYAAGVHPRADYTAPDSMAAHYNGTITLPAAATTADGYTFLGWNDGENTYDALAEYTVLGTTMLTAQYSENSYTVAYNANNGTGTLPENKTVLFTEEFTVGSGQGLNRNGYLFSGWNTAADGSGTDYSANATANCLSGTNGATVTLYAQWTTDDYVISYEYAGGAASNPTSYVVTDLPIAINEPAKAGYAFAGWEIESTGEYVMSNNMICAGTWGHLTFTATWTPTAADYTVEHYQRNLDNDGVTFVERETLTGISEQMTAAVAKEYTGFTAQTITQQEIAGDGSTVVEVYYDRNEYAVSYAYTGIVPTGAPSAPATADYTFEQTVNLETAPTLTGYAFSGWASEDVVIENGSFTMPAQAVAVTGSWSPAMVNYTVRHFRQNVADDEYTEVVGDVETLTGYTESQTEAIAKDYTGFTPLEITQAEILPDGSTVINVYYDRNEYQVTYAYTGVVPEGAANVPTTVSYRYGASVSVEAAPTLRAYAFSGWATGNVPVVDGVFTMQAGDVAFTGSWEAIPYTITFTTNGIAMEPMIYTITSTEQIPVSTGYALSTFQYWTVTEAEGNWVEGATLNAGTALTGRYGNVTLTAMWNLEIEYELEEYKYAYTGWYMLRVSGEGLPEGQTYTFNGLTLYYTTDANYALREGDGVFYTLISADYVSVDAETGICTFTVEGVEQLGVATGELVMVDYNGDVYADGSIRIADANDVFQMLAQNTAGGYYGLSQLGTLNRLTADMSHDLTETDHRGSIADVHAIVNIINGVV